MRNAIRFAGLTLTLLALSTVARAEVNDCIPITTLPFSTSYAGIYCLTSDLNFPSPSGIAIFIQADNVVLDLNGHVLDGSAAGPATTTYGIYTTNSSVTVRNGTVRGFYTGVQVGNRNAQHTIAEDLRVDGSTTFGLVVRSQGGIARRNLVTRTGGATSFLAIGIYGLGDGVHVVDNEVVATVEGPGGEATGIRVDTSTGAVVERNVVSNAAFGPTNSFGIRFSQGSPRATIVGNRIVNYRNGIFFTSGGSGIYMDNTVGSALVPFTGGTAAGATNFTF